MSTSSNNQIDCKSLTMESVMESLDPMQHDKYEWLEVIGEGSFGKVTHIVRKSDGKHMACKNIMCEDFEEEDFDNLQGELQILKELDFNGTPKCYGIFCDEDKTVSILMELCKGGHLYERMADSGKEGHKLSESLVTKYVTQILRILQFLHSNDIIHCDLKPHNFVFVSKESHELKILDFGLSQIRGKGKRCFKLQGTPKYIAPEAIDKRGYTETFDMWSLGVITFEMLHGYTPFATGKKMQGSLVNPQIIMKTISRGFKNVRRKSKGPWFNRHINISPEAQDFIVSLLKKNPVERMTAKEGLHHPWITNNTEVNHNEWILGDKAFKHMEHFANHSSIQTVMMPLIVAEAKKLNAFLIEKLDEDFMRIDEDGSGEIDFDEFLNLINQLDGMGVDDEIAKSWFTAIDVDASGTVNHDEFLEFFAWEHVVNTDIRFWDLMEKFDIDDKGYVTMEDVEKMLSKCDDSKRLLGTPAMRGFQKLFDESKEGRIEIEKFTRIMKYHHAEYDSQEFPTESFRIKGASMYLEEESSEETKGSHIVRVNRKLHSQYTMMQ